MSEAQIFTPVRRQGLLLHFGLALLLLGVSAGSLYFATQAAVGAYFVLLLLLSVLLLPPAVLAAYRGYALLRASYTLERDGLKLRWGLRGEDIPLPEVEWVIPAADLGFALPLPGLSLPGGILGRRMVEGLGLVEYLAGDAETLILVATRQQVYVISPADPREFLSSFQRVMEMGSLSPIEPLSARPAAFVQNVWGEPFARVLLAAGLGVMVVLFIAAGVLIPGHGPVALGYDARGLPLQAGPPERALLLPVLGALTYGFNLLLGLFFFRLPENRPVAYLLWISSLAAGVLLFAAVLILLL